MSYYWSFDRYEEVWNNNESTIEECINEARMQNGEYGKTHKVVYIATSTDYIASIDAGDIIENLEDNAFSEHGECSEGWLDGIDPSIVSELDELLNNALNTWLSNNGLIPTFGRLDDMWCYDLVTGEEVVMESECDREC